MNVLLVEPVEHSHFMKSECGVWAKNCRGEEALFLTTEYTEAGEPILKNTERSSVYSVWERSDLSVYSVVKKGGGARQFLHSHFMKSECEVWARVEINSEPNKRLPLTRSLASRRAGTIIAAGGAAAARRGTGGEGYQKLARESTGQILVKHSLTINAKWLKMHRR